MSAKDELQEILRRNPHLKVMAQYTATSPGETAVAAEDVSAEPAPKKKRQKVVGGTAVFPTAEQKWTETEHRFAREWLEPMMDTGEALWYMAQVPIYMLGQTYTMDFVAAMADGRFCYYEVKGEYKTLGEDRQSVKLRWLTQYLRKTPGHVVYKCDWRSKRGGETKWHIRQIKLERGKPQVAKESRDE